MSIDKLLVIVFTFFGIGFTYWFFLMRSEKEVTATSDSIDILVEGGYQPETISIPKGKTTKINFFRKNSSSCLEEVMLPDFKIRKYLPLNKATSISITPKKSGTFEISCGMNMFHGKIKVV